MDWDHFDETDELEDREYPDETDDDLRSDEPVFISCPECGASVYEEAPQCPECGFYLTDATRTALATSWKLVAVVALIAFGIGLLSVFF